jgi:hypothetical protein
VAKKRIADRNTWVLYYLEQLKLRKRKIPNDYIIR